MQAERKGYQDANIVCVRVRSLSSWLSAAWLGGLPFQSQQSCLWYVSFKKYIWGWLWCLDVRRGRAGLTASPRLSAHSACFMHTSKKICHLHSFCWNVSQYFFDFFWHVVNRKSRPVAYPNLQTCRTDGNQGEIPALLRTLTTARWQRWQSRSPVQYPRTRI